MDYPMGPMPEISYTFNYILISTVLLSIFVLTFSNQVDKLIMLFPKLERLLSNMYTCLEEVRKAKGVIEDLRHEIDPKGI